jgi:hypothetical protein
MPVSEQDLQLLELYLDHELPEQDVRSLDQRLSLETSLAERLESLRQQRQLRRSAMSVAFDTDAAAVERLVLSVRTARASEALKLRRSFSIPWRSVGVAAASLLIGLGIGSFAGQDPARPDQPIGPIMSGVPGVFNSNAGYDASPAPTFVVALRDPATGQIVQRIRFVSREAAEEYIRYINQVRAGQISVDPRPEPTAESY